MHGPMPRLAIRVAVVGVMSRVASWTCQWPTKRALAVADAAVELLGLEELPGLELVAPLPDVFFEHPASTAVTISVAAIANTAADLARCRNGVSDFHIDAIMGRQYGSARTSAYHSTTLVVRRCEHRGAAASREATGRKKSLRFF